jgi:hypothetical protein
LRRLWVEEFRADLEASILIVLPRNWHVAGSSWLTFNVKFLAFLIVAVSFAACEGDPRPYPYLLRISHETFDDYSCALLQTNGAFHLEVAHGDDIKVHEGTADLEDVKKVQRILEGSQLAGLSERQVEEPIFSGRTEKLQLTMYRGDHWQDLFFQSLESEEPFKQSLDPLVEWLEGLRKLPHRELSEDEGKQNCLPPRKIVLKKREPASFPDVEVANRLGTKSVLKLPPLATAPAMPSATPLLRVLSVVVGTSDARQFCALIADNGHFRFENHVQKTGKPVHTEVFAGHLSLEELSRLRSLLDTPALADIRHREPRGTAAVPMMGDLLNLSIARPDGVQNIILSSNYGHEFGTVYGGDGDVRSAAKLMEFLNQRLPEEKGGMLDKSARNDCTALP